MFCLFCLFQIDHWITFSDSQLTKGNVEKSLQLLNEALLNCSYLVSDRLTIADLAMFDKLSRKRWRDGQSKGYIYIKQI